MWIIVGIVLGVVAALTVWAAYAVGKDHGRFESDQNWRIHRFMPWTENIGKRIWNLEQKVQFWHGKYAIVKHENNKLRKKITKGAIHGQETDIQL